MSQANKPLKGTFINPHNHTAMTMWCNESKEEQVLNISNQQRQNHSGIQASSPHRMEDLCLHGTKMKSNIFERLSKVLLVIFNGNDIKSNQDIFDIFSPYVRVIRILIFGRKDTQIKCFVEMKSMKEATYVKNQFPFQYGTKQYKNIQIYYAQIQTINLQNHYSEGQDFSNFYGNNPNISNKYLSEFENPINPNNCTEQLIGESQIGSQQQSQSSPPFNYFPNPNGQFVIGSLGQSSNINSYQYHHNYVASEFEEDFDLTYPFMEKGIQPSSISSTDFSKQCFLQSTKVNPLLRSSIDSFSNKCLINDNAINLGGSTNSLYEPLMYSNEIHPSFKKLNSLRDSVIPSPQQISGQLKQNFRADRFCDESTSQSHLSPKFEAIKTCQQKIQTLDPCYLNCLKDKQGYSQSSSTNRSPSSTSYSLTNGQPGCDLSDVDENVQISQPQTFQTKYRDIMFFNGNYPDESNNERYSQQGRRQSVNSANNKYDDSGEINIEDNEEAKRVIFVRHLDSTELKMNMIYNLFSNYGNIMKIIFMKHKRQALIEFENISQSAAAKDNLNNLLYYGAEIKIDYSKYDQIDLQQKKHQSHETNDQKYILQIPSQCFRYKPSKFIPQYAPKSTLHVSNIRKEYFEKSLLYDFFAQFGARITMIKLIPNEKKQMCLVQFETLDDALRVISTLHDTPFNGRNLCISFTKNFNQIQVASNNIKHKFIQNSSFTHTSSALQQGYNIQQVKSLYSNKSPNIFNHYEQTLLNDYKIHNFQDPNNNSFEDSLQQDIQTQILNLSI